QLSSSHWGADRIGLREEQPSHYPMLQNGSGGCRQVTCRASWSRLLRTKRLLPTFATVSAISRHGPLVCRSQKLSHLTRHLLASSRWSVRYGRAPPVDAIPWMA